MTNIEIKPTSQMHFGKTFPKTPIKWKERYFLLHKVTQKTYLPWPQYKTLNNILHLNNELYTYKLRNRPLCSF